MSKIKEASIELKKLTWADLRDGNILADITELRIIMEDINKIVRLK